MSDQDQEEGDEVKCPQKVGLQGVIETNLSLEADETLTESATEDVTENVQKTPDRFHADDTLPSGLCIKESNIPGGDGSGVFTTVKLPENIWFGPYVGEVMKLIGRSRRYWAIYEGTKLDHFICGENKETSNWMRFVNKAKLADQRNLEPVQYQNQIYYQTTKDIAPNTELLLLKSLSINRGRITTIDPVPAVYVGVKTEKGEKNAGTCDDEIITHISAAGPTGIWKNNERDVNKKLPKFSIADRKQFHCSICPRYFSNWTSHRLHVRISHSPGDTYIDYKFLTEGSDNNATYSYKKSGYKKPKCDVCKRNFSCPSELKRHLSSHKRTFTCTECGEKFHRICALQRHRNKHPGVKIFICSVCKKKYLNYTGLRDHINIVHNGERGFRCDQCPAVVSNRAMLMRHKRIHDNKREIIHCTQCNKGFVRKETLNRHMFFIHGEPTNVRAHLCTTCGIKCSSPKRLQVHERIHTGERPFFCVTCDKTFMSQINLNRHVRALHAEKTLMCSTCGKLFTCVAYLKRHQRSHSSSAPPPVHCEYCRRQFARQASLMRHMRQVHHIDGVFTRHKHTCHVCGKSVARLDSHMKIHSEQKNYHCVLCNEAFLWHKQLKRHVAKEHHG